MCLGSVSEQVLDAERESEWERKTEHLFWWWSGPGCRWIKYLQDSDEIRRIDKQAATDRQTETVTEH